MRIGKPGLTVVLIAGLALMGCEINPRENGYYPKVAGNTFDPQNSLAVVLPAAARINISYEFALADDDADYIDADGFYKGPLWWYEERATDVPEQFLAIHLLTRDERFDEPKSTAQQVKLSRTSFNVYEYCLDLGSGEIPPSVRPYVESLLKLDRPLSSDIYIRHYAMRDERKGHERTDVIYVRDVVRLGYTCEMIGDLRDPDPDSKDILSELRSDARASFEMMS